MITKNRNNKWLLFFLLLLLIGGGLVACSSDEPTSSDDPEEQEPAESNEDPTDEPDEPAAVDKTSFEGKLKILTPWTWLAEPFAGLIADFNKEYPNVEVELMEQTIAELPALIASGEVPDLFSCGCSYDWVEDGLIEDLAMYIESDPDVDLNMFYPLTVERNKINGVQYGLPWHIDVLWGTFYKPHILDQFGITEFPDIRTLQELDEFNRQFWTVSGGEQETVGFRLDQFEGPEVMLMTLAYANGADEYTFYDPDTRTANFNDPLIVEALEYMVNFRREVVDDERWHAMHAALPEGMDLFAADKQVIGITQAPGGIGGIYGQYPEGEVELGLFAKDGLWFGGWNWAMTSVGENKELAWELLKWMVATESGAKSQLEHFSWYAATIDNPILDERRESDPVAQTFYEGLQATQKIPYGSILPIGIGEEFNIKFEEVMAGDLEPKAFLDHINNYAQTLIDERYAESEDQ